MKCIFVVLAFLPVTLMATDSTRYTILTTEKVTGKQVMWTDGRGKVSYWFEFNDRGRGPKIQVDLQILDGQIISRTATGVDYFKGAVNETFGIANGVATWKNKLEDDRRNISGPVIYSPMDGAPGEIEWTLKILLRQNARVHEMDVLPSGKVKAIHVKSHTAMVNGFPEELELYSFTGSGGPPEYVWFTPNKAYFASISGWSSIIRRGYEFLVPEMKKLQDEVEQEYFALQEDNLTIQPAGPVAITHVAVFNSKTGKVVNDQTVVLENSKITEVGKAGSVQVPANAKVIDGKGKMVLPGLWDNHAHYGISQGLYHLAAGVTNIKDMANGLDLPEIKAKVDRNELMGPDISIMSGFIDFAGPFAGPTGKIVKTLDEGKAAVNFYADKGYQQVKLYSSIPVEWVKPLAQEAHKRGMKVCGHVPSYMTAERAINDGYDQVIHMNMIMLNFMGDTIDTRSMGRFIKVAERARGIDVGGAQAKNFAKMLKAKGIVVDPTVGIFENMFTDEPGKLAAAYESIQSTFPAEFRRGLYRGGLPMMKGHEAQYKESFANMLKMLKLLYTTGVTFVPGTDDFPGFALHRELEIYAKAGVPNKEVLQKATYLSAKVAGKENEVGSIEPGMRANLILVAGDPVKNISDIRRVELTFKGGNMYDSKKLYASYGFGYWK